MAFRFNWPEFNQDFIAHAQTLLNVALNKGSKPTNIVSEIVVKELNMGTKPPELEILEIGELAEDKFRGIFKLTYDGDAFIVLQTKVQANPVTPRKMGVSILGNARRDILAADQPLVLPMQLRISSVCLKGIIVLVVDRLRGVTLVFKNDPLERVDVSSTFDSMTNVQRFLQAEIEKQLRAMFQDELPDMVHKLSLNYLMEKQKERTGKISVDGQFPEGLAEFNSFLAQEQADRGAAAQESGHFVGMLDPENVDRPRHTRSHSSPARWIGNSFEEEEVPVSAPLSATTYTRLSQLHKEVGLKKLTCEFASDRTSVHNDNQTNDDSSVASSDAWERDTVVSTGEMSTISGSIRPHICHSYSLYSPTHDSRKSASTPTIPSYGTPSARASHSQIFNSTMDYCDSASQKKGSFSMCESPAGPMHGARRHLNCSSGFATPPHTAPDEDFYTPRPSLIPQPQSPLGHGLFGHPPHRCAENTTVNSPSCENSSPYPPRPSLHTYHTYSPTSSHHLQQTPPPQVPNKKTAYRPTATVTPSLRTSSPQLARRQSMCTRDNIEHADDASNRYGSETTSSIVLQPSLNAMAAQLTSLMSSNHTLSPNTRTLQHLTFRSTPTSASTMSTSAKMPRSSYSSAPLTRSTSAASAIHVKESMSPFTYQSPQKPRKRTQNPHVLKLPGLTRAGLFLGPGSACTGRSKKTAAEDGAGMPSREKQAA